MYRLLIVDDEPHITEWLYELLNGADIANLDLYLAYSAEEGLSLMRQQRFDILLTDIHMPGMSGIDFAARVCESWPQCKIIFLTGYDAFEYAYKAIQFNSMGYILKLEDDDVVVKTVAKAVDMLDDVSHYQSVLQRAEHSDAVIRYLTTAAKVSHRLHDRKSADMAPLRTDRPVLLLCGRRDSGTLENVVLNAKTSAELMLLSEAFFRGRMSLVLMEYRALDYIWILQPQSGEDPLAVLYLSETLEAFQRACEQVLDMPLCVTFCEEYVAWDELREKIDLLSRVASMRTAYEGGQPYTFSSRSLPAPDLFEPSPALLRLLGTGQLQSLEAHLARGNKDGFLNCLDQTIASFSTTTSMHDLSATEIYLRIALMLLSHITQCNLATKLAFSVGLGRLTQYAEFHSWSEAGEYLRDVSEKLFQLQQYEQVDRTLGLINQIKDDVQNHIGGDLSLLGISERVHYSVSYISRVFKRETGHNLIDHIVGARISRAKLLLSTTQETVKAIGAMVGYESPQYFATVFKRETGSSPQEYRNPAHHPSR